MSHHNAGQNYDTNTAYTFLKNVTNFNYLGIKIINKNYIHEEVKSRLNLGIAC